MLLNKSLTGTFFQSTEWLSLWLTHFGGSSEIIGVYEDEVLVGIAPFIKGNGIREFLGGSAVQGTDLVSDFGDIISLPGREKEVWKAVIKNYKNNRLELNFVRENSPSLKILTDLGGKIEEVDVAPYLDLPHAWEEYLLQLSRHDRHELKRKIRKAQDAGVTQTSYADNPQEIEEFFKLMVLGNKEKRDFLSLEMKAFFRSVIETLYLQKLLDLTFLKLDGVYIAAAMLFNFKAEVLLYNSGFNPEYSFFSPGLILKAYTIKEAIESGKSRYDFLRGGERYKYDLGGKERKLFRVTIV